jgi:hypothetical protein
MPAVAPCYSLAVTDFLFRQPPIIMRVRREVFGGPVRHSHRQLRARLGP